VCLDRERARPGFFNPQKKLFCGEAGAGQTSSHKCVYVDSPPPVFPWRLSQHLPSFVKRKALVLVLDVSGAVQRGV
jgi:hypothetical protein